MYSSSLLVLALAVFGASAQTLISSGCGLNGLVGVSGINTGVVGVSGLVGGLTGVNTGIIGGVAGVNTGVIGGVSTPVFENLPLRLPSIVQPTTVQDSCNCVKTVVRPQLRKEVYTIPSVQRFVQTTSTPVVETVPYVSGSAADVPAVAGVDASLVSGTGLIAGSGLVSGVSGLVNAGVVNTGFGGVTGVVSGINTC